MLCFLLYVALEDEINTLVAGHRFQLHEIDTGGKALLTSNGLRLLMIS